MTPGYDALGYSFSARADDPRIERYVADLYAAFEPVDDASHVYAVERNDADDDDELRAVRLTVDGEMLTSAAAPEALLMHLVHDVNQRAVSGCPHLVLHAGGIEHDGTAVALPGVMEAGKTTLTAGLVRAGLGYLTDEAVAVDHRTLQVHPYPKPFSLDPGSWELFPELEPHADLGCEEYKYLQWQVPPAAFRPDAVGRPCPIGLIVFPHYEAGADTRLEPLGRAEGLIEAAKNTFRFNEHSRESLDVLAEVVRGAECYRLPIGNLGDAVARVCELVGARSQHPA